MIICMWDMNVSIYWKNNKEEDMPGLGTTRNEKRSGRLPLSIWHVSYDCLPSWSFTSVLLWQNPSDVAVLWLNIQIFNPKLMADDILNVLIFPAPSVVTFAISDTFYHYIVDSSHGTTLGTTLELNFILKHFLPRYPPMLCLPRSLG